VKDVLYVSLILTALCELRQRNTQAVKKGDFGMLCLIWGDIGPSLALLQGVQNSFYRTPASISSYSNTAVFCMFTMFHQNYQILEHPVLFQQRIISFFFLDV
jgi:hypothetical protein